MAARQQEPDRSGSAAVEELLAAARFRVPELAAFHVPRPRLMRALTRADQVPLVLVSAPAGTGKTSLAAEWAARRGNTGWITFEDGDTAFWGPVIEGLNRIGLEVPTPDGETTGCLGRERLRALAEAIVRTPQRLTLVLDGPLLASLELAHEIDFLLRHTLGRLSLVLLSRVDPVLPLYRYRLTDTLLEIRAADIAFTDEEASRLLRRSGVKLSPGSVRDLNRRTRGWAAGLRFAALTLAGQSDPEQAVATVVSQANDINEYLIGEVLDAQPPQVRRFLLDTCLPDVLLPGLAEELAGPGAGHTLGLLSRSNAFLEPVADQPGAYRYYPFFRELLRAQLGYESPHAMVDLHRRAARWFRRAGLRDQAIGHLAAIGAWDEVADDMVNDLTIGRLLLDRGDGPIGRVTLGPVADLDGPAPELVRAALALANGDRPGCAAALTRLRSHPGAATGAVAIVAAVLDAVRASTADPVSTAERLVAAAERALGEPRPDSPGQSELAAVVRLSRGVVLLRQGDLEAARRTFSLVAGSEAARSHPAFRAGCLGYLAITEALKGRLSRATRTATESLTLLDAAKGAGVHQPPAARVALARVALDQYELKAAREHVAVATAHPALRTDPVCHILTEGIIASLERVSGQLRPALARLAAAATGVAATDPWLARFLRVEAAKLSMASGQTELARSVLEPIEQGDNDPEVAAVAAAVYVEQGRDAAVAASLARIRNGQSPLPARVTGLLVEVVQESRHRPGRTRVILDRSLRLAAPEELRRPFREAGPSVRRLLSADPRLLIENPWLNQSGEAMPARDRNRAAPVTRSAVPDVVEPLTAKELEVLGHLQELLTTEEIALRMFVSVNTVRTHVRSILRKLGVSRRNAAVRRARELGLVG